jgi:hypothetical protein
MNIRLIKIEVTENENSPFSLPEQKHAFYKDEHEYIFTNVKQQKVLLTDYTNRLQANS